MYSTQYALMNDVQFFCRVLIIKKDRNSLKRFLWECCEEYWTQTNECKKRPVHLLLLLRRFSHKLSHWLSLYYKLHCICCSDTPFQQEAAEELVLHLEVILQHLLCAFGRYQVDWVLTFLYSCTWSRVQELSYCVLFLSIHWFPFSYFRGEISEFCMMLLVL